MDALFCNGLTRLGDLSKEAILQAIKDGDLRFLQASSTKMRKIITNRGIIFSKEKNAQKKIVLYYLPSIFKHKSVCHISYKILFEN